jgi:hypothetical protein
MAHNLLRLRRSPTCASSLVALVALAACGASETTPQEASSATTDAGPRADGAVADSATTVPEDASIGNSAPPADGGTSAGLGPTPPAGFTLCGAGAFTQADAQSGCTAFGAGPKRCEVVTIGGGTWQAWCEPGKTKVYFWAQLAGADQVPKGCVPKFVIGGYDLSPGGSGGWGTVRQDGATASLDGVLPITYQASGVGALAARAQLGTPSGGSSPCLYEDPSAPIVTAFNVTW